MNINKNLPTRPEVDCGVKMCLFTGRYVDPMDLRVEEVDIEDIASGLSKMCRFAGQCRDFYSVAQHSVLVAQEVFRATKDIQQARIALLHDAPEAYVCDLVRAVKAHLPDYQDMEYGIWVSVVQKFQLEPLLSLINDDDEAEIPPHVKQADFRMLVTERRDLMNFSDVTWDLQKKYKPYASAIIPVGPKEAWHLFLQAYAEYFTL